MSKNRIARLGLQSRPVGLIQNNLSGRSYICLTSGDRVMAGRAAGFAQPSWRCSTFKENPKKSLLFSFFLSFFVVFCFRVPHEKTWKWIEVSPIVHIFIRRATNVPKRQPAKEKEWKQQKKNRTGAVHLQPNRETRKATAAAAAADHREFETDESPISTATVV